MALTNAGAKHNFCNPKEIISTKHCQSAGGNVGTTLDTLKPGSQCVVTRILARGKLSRRLMDLGLYNGQDVRVVRNAPLQDPMEIELDGNFISLRHEEARFVEVNSDGR